MLWEIGSSVAMLGVAGFAYLKQNRSIVINDADKIQKIFYNSGWIKREGEIRIHRKRKIDGGMEYVFQTPLGFDRKKVEERQYIIEDGLNIRHKYFEFDLAELLKIKWDRTAFQQIKKILTSKKIARKEVEIEFDGMLRIRVYYQPIEKTIPWDENQLNTDTWAVS